MPPGGARPGAGRKKGSKSTRTREIAEKIAAGGLTPLEIMDMAAKAHMAAAHADPRNLDKAELDKAAMIARDMAPYIHPRLAAVQHSGSLDSRVTIEETSARELVESRIAGLAARTGTETDSSRTIQ